MVGIFRAQRIDRDSIELGACVALAHAAQLLEDAATLYASKDDQTVDAAEMVEGLQSHTKKLLARNAQESVEMIK